MPNKKLREGKWGMNPYGKKKKISPQRKVGGKKKDNEPSGVVSKKKFKKPKKGVM